MIPLRPLPYGFEDLEPVMSSRSLRYHYELYSRYVDRTRAGVGPGVDSLGAAIEYAGVRGDTSLREQATQAWAHECFFSSMRPPGPGFGEAWERRLAESFGATGAFVSAWAAAATSIFGSGWVWLTAGPSGGLRIETIRDTGLPNGAPLLACDVWEHAYYLDYPAERASFARRWITELAAWEQAAEAYEAM